MFTFMHGHDVDNDIIKVNYNKLTNVWSKYMMLESYESTKLVCKSKGYNEPLIKSAFSFKRDFPFITFFNPNLIIIAF